MDRGGESMSRLGVLLVGVVLGAASVLIWGAVLHLALYKDQPAQAQPVYLIRRGEFTIIDKRQDPDRSINPSWMEPNMRYTCTETK